MIERWRGRAQPYTVRDADGRVVRFAERFAQARGEHNRVCGCGTYVERCACGHPLARGHVARGPWPAAACPACAGPAPLEET